MKSVLRSAVLLALSATPALATPPSAARFEAMADDIFRPLMATYDIPGLVVGLSIEGQRYYFHEGVASRDDAVPVETRTIFEIGSVTKLFTASLAALAEAEGELSLGEPLALALPDLAGTSLGSLRLVDLATHGNGGLPLQVPGAIDDFAGFLAYARDFTPPRAARLWRSYSNPGIGLLGKAVSARLGTSYTVAAQARLLVPLGLADTGFEAPADARRYAMGYDQARAPARVSPGLFDAESYGLRSTAPDLLRFLEAHMGEGDTPPAMRVALRRTLTGEADAGPFIQALVWERYDWPVAPARLAAGNAPAMAREPQPMRPLAAALPPDGAALFAKTGSTRGFGAYVAMVPSLRIAVVVLANHPYPNPARAEAAIRLISALSRAGGE